MGLFSKVVLSVFSSLVLVVAAFGSEYPISNGGAPQSYQDLSPVGNLVCDAECPEVNLEELAPEDLAILAIINKQE